MTLSVPQYPLGGIANLGEASIAIFISKS